MSSNIRIIRICEHCKNEFTAKTSNTRFCSHTCNTRAYKSSVNELRAELSNKETQRIISRPFNELTIKPFLSIQETSMLLGVSRRTIYRLMEKEKLNVGKIGSRSIIQRADIDKLFPKA